MGDIRAGDTVDFTVTAEVVCVYQSGRIKVRWHSGEENISTFDTRLNND